MGTPYNPFGWVALRYVLASSSQRVHCFVSSGKDAGKVVWESDEIQPATRPVVVPAPTGDGNWVYVVSNAGTLYALDLKDGHVVQQWPFTLGEIPRGFLGSSDNLLAFQTGDTLFGFQLDTHHLWHYGQLGDYPAAMGSGGRVYWIDTHGKLHAVTSSGADAWTYGGWLTSPSPGAGTHIYRNPVPRGSFVHVRVDLGSNNEDILRLTTTEGTFAGKTIEPGGWGVGAGFDIDSDGSGIYYISGFEYNWLAGANRGWVAALGFDGTTVWRTPPVEGGIDWYHTDPVASEYVFVASFGQDAKYLLYAFDLVSGAKAWASDTSVGTPGAPGAPFNWLSDLELETDGGPNVFVASQNGYLYAFSRADGTLAWTAALPANWSGSDDTPRKPTTWFQVLSQGRQLEIPASVDPLWLILPHWLYVALHKPYPPLAGPQQAELSRRIRALTRSVPPAVKEGMRARARLIGAYADLVDKALADQPPGGVSDGGSPN